MYHVGTVVRVKYGEKSKGGIIVGYGVSHSEARLSYSKTPESVYLIEYAVPLDLEGFLVSQVVVHPDNIVLDLECDCCGESISKDFAVMTRNYVYDLNGEIHYTDGVQWTCYSCSK